MKLQMCQWTQRYWRQTVETFHGCVLDVTNKFVYVWAVDLRLFLCILLILHFLLFEFKNIEIIFIAIVLNFFSQLFWVIFHYCRNEMEDYKFLFKVVLIGNAGVGKCSWFKILVWLLKHEFPFKLKWKKRFINVENHFIFADLFLS